VLLIAIIVFDVGYLSLLFHDTPTISFIY